VAYTIAAGSQQNAWQLYVTHHHRDPAQSSFDHITAKRAEFSALPEEEKKNLGGEGKS
jgi:hypothetical protein